MIGVADEEQNINTQIACYFVIKIVLLEKHRSARKFRVLKIICLINEDVFLWGGKKGIPVLDLVLMLIRAQDYSSVLILLKVNKLFTVVE